MPKLKRFINLKNAGICYHCKKPAVSGKVLCVFHLNRNNKSSLANYHRIRKEGGIREVKRSILAYKKNARARKYCFTLSLKEFEKIVSLPCNYCGKRPPENHFNGVDRVNNKFGYTIKNSTPCCWICNFMKHHLSKDVFLSHVKTIQTYQDNGGIF